MSDFTLGFIVGQFTGAIIVWAVVWLHEKRRPYD